MSKSLVVIMLLSIFVWGCGKTTSQARTSDEFLAMVQSSPELQAMDGDLDSLEDQTEALEASYHEIEGKIVQNATLDSEQRNQSGQLVVYINENNVLIVNDSPMSRNDFQAFANRQLPLRCTPTPRLSIHKKADYDTAAWVLDSIYSHGCMNVDVE